MTDQIVIFSAIPGRHRGGMTHPHMAEYPLGSIGRSQLSEILADPVLAVARGELVTIASMAQLLDDNDAAAKGAAKGVKKA